MNSEISKVMNDQLIDELVEARMQHIHWVSQVLKDEKFEAEEDHTRCNFGLWMVKVKELLGELEELQDVDVPHRELHMVYKVLKNNPAHTVLREELKLLSCKLIDRVDQLENRLKEGF